MSAVISVIKLEKDFNLSSGVFGRKGQVLRALDKVSFEINEGECFGLVGESGCGKTTLGRTIIRLYEPTSGSVLFKGEDVFRMRDKTLMNFRAKAQIVFQNPFLSLNPRKNILQIVGEPLKIHGISRKEGVTNRVATTLERVGLAPDSMYRYPHEFSGGQRQRIAIARALISSPEFLVLDEPTSSLDVSVQARIINDLKNLQKEFNLTYLFISHNMSVVKHLSQRIGVMYLGKIVELTESKELFGNPMHPYTEMLLASIPVPNPAIVADMAEASGDVPSSLNVPSGCRFHTRCPYAVDLCTKEEPELLEVGKNHFVACHIWTKKGQFPDGIQLKGIKPSDQA